MESEPPYQYVGGNVVNLVDPSGMQPPCKIPEICAVSSPTPVPIPTPTPQSYQGPSITTATQICREDDFFEAGGYADGEVVALTIGGHLESLEGEEIVYDFATMERARYSYEEAPLLSIPNYNPPGYGNTIFETVKMIYTIRLNHFESYKNLDYEYSGYFSGINFGVGTPFVQVGFGGVRVTSPEVSGDGHYQLLGIGVSPSIIKVWIYRQFAVHLR